MIQLASAGTSTGAGVLTLVVPIGLVIVVLGIWWVALRRGRGEAVEATSHAAAGSEEPPPALHGP